jgi:hypothetical protein
MHTATSALGGLLSDGDAHGDERARWFALRRRDVQKRRIAAAESVVNVSVADVFWPTPFAATSRNE